MGEAEEGRKPRGQKNSAKYGAVANVKSPFPPLLTNRRRLMAPRAPDTSRGITLPSQLYTDRSPSLGLAKLCCRPNPRSANYVDASRLRVPIIVS